MKKYNITVNGNRYEVEVEEAGTSQTYTGAPQSQTISQPEPAPEAKPEPKVEEKPKPEAKVEAPKEVKTPSANVEMINAPMPGSIFQVKVAVGDMVKEGDTLLLLEAMKMENEIMAPRDGKVVEVNISKGQAVETGDSLIALE